ncbi:MAG: hypothetical protein ACETWM_12090 [Candidatus Lokiarchaeia archaeon]
MEKSFLSSQISRISNILLRGVERQLTDYKNRFSSIEEINDFISKILVTDLNLEKAYKTAVEFFGSDRVRFAAVDGTEYSRRLFDFILFFGGAYAANGEIQFHKDSKPTVDYYTKHLEEGRGISSCVPVYINEVPEIDQTFFSEGDDPEGLLTQPLSEQEIADNSQIANWIMTFAEYYLAYLLVTDPSDPVKVLFLDRSLSGTQRAIAKETSKKTYWEKKCAIVGFKVDGEPIDRNDLFIGRYRVLNPELGLPPARGDFLRHSMILLLERKESPLTLKQICEELGIKDPVREEKVGRYLNSLVREEIILKSHSKYRINPRYRNSWERISKMVRTLGQGIFQEGIEGSASSSKMIIDREDGTSQYLSTLDIAFLTLFCFYMLIEECWKRKVLLLGITKDTAASDFKNHFIPVCSNCNLFGCTISPESFSILPNTDRMLLQSFSFNCSDTLHPPWSLIEYDSAFTTIVPDHDRGPWYVRGARKNKITMERLFLKTYIQLQEAEHDSKLRSNVLLIDRLAYPEYDMRKENIESFHQIYVGEEPVNIFVMKSEGNGNELQNLTLVILRATTTATIPEVFGHNKPLFIADNVAKWNYSLFKNLIDTTKEWIMTNKDLKKFVYYMTSFRERRGELERLRRRA